MSINNSQNEENKSPNIVSGARFNGGRQIISNQNANNALTGGPILKSTSPAQTPDGVSPKFNQDEASPKLCVNPGVSKFDKQKNNNAQSSKPTNAEKVDSKNHVLALCNQVSLMDLVQKQPQVAGEQNSTVKPNDEVIENPETQKSDHNQTIVVKNLRTSIISDKKERGESLEEADSFNELICQEQQIDPKVNEQNVSQPIEDTLIISQKNEKAEIQQQFVEPLSNKVITTNIVNLTKSKSMRVPPTSEKPIIDNKDVQPEIQSPFVQINYNYEVKMKVEAPNAHFSGDKTKFNARASETNTFGAGLSEPVVKYNRQPSNYNRGLMMTNSIYQNAAMPLQQLSYPMFPAQTPQSNFNNWVTPQKKTNNTFRDSSTKQINFSGLGNLQANLSPRETRYRSSRKISNNFFHGDELMSSGNKSKNPGKINRLLSRNASPEKDVSGLSPNSKSYHSKTPMSSFGPTSKKYGQYNCFQDIIDGRASPIKGDQAPIIMLSRNKEQAQTRSPKILSSASKRRIQSTRNPFDKGPIEEQRSFSPSPENQSAISIKINTPSAKKKSFAMNSVSIRKQQNKSPYHRSACYKSPIITNQNNDTQEKYKTKGGSIISLRFASSSRKKQDRIQTSQVKKLQYPDTQSQNRAKQTTDSVSKTPVQLPKYQSQSLVTQIIQIGGSSHINEEEFNQFISPDKKHPRNRFPQNDAVETNSNNLSGIKIKSMQSKLNKDSPNIPQFFQSQSSPESGSGYTSNSSNSQSSSDSSTPTSNMMTNQMHGAKMTYEMCGGYFTQNPQPMMGENPFQNQHYQNWVGAQNMFHMQKGCQNMNQIPMDPLLQNLVCFKQALHEQQQNDIISMIQNQQNGHAFHHTHNFTDGKSNDTECKCALQGQSSLPESRQETSVKKNINNSDLKTPETSPNKTQTPLTQFNYLYQPTFKVCMHGHNCNSESLGLMQQQTFGYPPQMGQQFNGMGFCQHLQPQNMNMFQPQWINAPQGHFQQPQFAGQYQNFPMPQFQMESQLHNVPNQDYHNQQVKKNQANKKDKMLDKRAKHHGTGQQKQSKQEDGIKTSPPLSKQNKREEKRGKKFQIQAFQMPTNMNDLETPSNKFQKTDDVKLNATAGNNKVLINMTGNGKPKSHKLTEDKKIFMTPSVNNGNTPSEMEKIPDFNEKMVNLKRFENTTNQKKNNHSKVFDDLSLKKKQSNTVQKPTRSVQDNTKPKSTRKTQEEKDKEAQIQNEQIQRKLQEILSKTISHEKLKLKENRVTPQIGCKCKKSGCSKLYCECLQNNGFCGPDCSCIADQCINNEQHQQQRQEAIEKILKQRIDAFEQKVKNAESQNVHFKGCTCKRSQCQKKYCECYQHGVKCTDSCKCNDCKNGKPNIHNDDDVQDEDGVSVEEEFQIESLVPESKHDNSHQREKVSDYENGQESLSVVENSCYTSKKAEYVSIDVEENKEASQSKNEILRQEQISSNCQHSVDKVPENVDESQIPHANQVALKTKKASSSTRKTQNTTSQMRKSSRLQQKKQVAFIKDNDQNQ